MCRVKTRGGRFSPSVDEVRGSSGCASVTTVVAEEAQGSEVVLALPHGDPGRSPDTDGGTAAGCRSSTV